MTTMTTAPRLHGPLDLTATGSSILTGFRAFLTGSSAARRTRYAQLLFRLTDTELARRNLSRDQIMPHVFGRYYYT